MPIVRTPDSAESIELAKFEQFVSHLAPNPGNPYVYRPYPKMLYRAQPNARAGGKVQVADSAPARYSFPPGPEGDAIYQQALLGAEQFTASCQRIVHSEHEQSVAARDGWCESPQDALNYHEGLQQDIARAAAEARYKEQGMSDKAKAEVRQAEAETGIQHVVDVVGKKRGRKPKAVTGSGPVEE